MDTQIDNKKALLCSRVFLQQSVKTSTSVSVQLHTVFNLRKYFPKYINDLQILVKTGSTISKIKRTKIIRSFQGPPNTGSQPWPKNLQRTLLYNKEKHIHEISTSLYTKSLTRDIKAFSGIQTLCLPDPVWSNYNCDLQFPYLKKICQFFLALINLKQLSLKIDCEQYLHTISKIDSCQRVLESLEVLKIFFHSTLSPEAKLLKHLLMYKNILKATTHFGMICSENEASNELLTQLLGACQKLTYFDFKEIQKRNENILTPTEASSCFSALRNLNNLRTLKVRVSQTWAFLRDFVLPPSIQNVEMDFLPFKNQMPLLPLFMDFCEKWNNVNLHSLKVEFRQSTDHADFIIPFLQELLKRIKSIQTLSLHLTPQIMRGFRSMPSQTTRELDLSSFMDSIKHLENSLKSLIVFDGEIKYSIKNLPERPLGLSLLQKLTLEGPAISDINKFFEVNLIDLISVDKEKPLVIILKGQIFDSLESFKSLIQIFDQANSAKRTLTVGIQAHIKSQPAMESSMHFPNKSFSFKLLSKNTTLKFKVTIKQEFLGDYNFKSDFIKSLQVLEFEEVSQSFFF